MSNLHEIPISVFGQPEAGQPRTFVTLSQDENGRLLRFKVIGGVTIPEGATAALVGTKPDGKVYSTTGTIDGNNIIIQEDIQMTAVAGTWDAKLDIVSGTNNIMSSIIRFLIVRNTVTAGSIPSDSQLDGIVAECKSYAEAAKNEAYGSPLTASTAAGMTDKQRVYVYTGSETGYTSGHWYYWDGTAWTDGGVYNSVAVDTDTTLSIAGKAADAKETGDQITELKSGLKEYIDKLDENTVQMMHYILQSIEPTTGKAYNTKTGTLESLGGNFVCVEFQVANGDQLKISGWGIADNYKPRFWNESAIVATPSVGGDDNGYFYDVEVTVPNGATRLLINGRIGGIVISKYGINSATEQYTSAVISEARNNVVTFDEIIPQTFSLNSGQYVDTSTGEASSLYGFAYVDFPVTAGDILLLSGYGNTASNAPAFWSASAIVKATGIVGDEENRFTDVRVVVPNGATRLLINGRPSFNINIAIKKVVNGDKSKRFFEEYDIAVEELSMARFNIKNLERRALNAEKANDFAWGAFDHPYFVFVHDDTNSFLPTAYSAFHAKGKPLGCATIVSKLENEYNNQTAKEWLDLVVADGGEVLTHWDYDLLSTSTDEEWYTHFVLPKRILEENGYDVRGAILANASHPYTAKGQSYCRKYYDYADKVGTTTQYRLGRTLMLNFADLPAFKSQLDIDLQSNGLYAYGFHGLRQDESWITEQNLKDIIDYIVDNGGIITTYASVFDAVGSTVLEQRISALE